MQHPLITMPPGVSRRAFLKASSALAGGAPLLAGLLKAQSGEAKGPLLAYVGTFSSPLRDVLPTQVDPNEPAAISLPPGDGPRHFHFHSNGRWLYSIQEEGSNIVLFDYAAATGQLTARQTISSLPPGFAGSNFCSEILVSADGRFVYAGNRLHDSIGIFSVGKTGELTFVREEWTRGNYPRSFNLDPSGRFLYSCNQRADNIAAFRVNRKTGGLVFTGHYTPVGNPSIIVFLDLAKAG